MDNHHAAQTLQAAKWHVQQDAVARLGVDALGGRRTLLVDLLGFISSHAFVPVGHGLGITRLGQVLVGRLVHLLDHGLTLHQVAAGVDDIHAHDDLLGTGAGELHVVGRVPPASLHDMKPQRRQLLQPQQPDQERGDEGKGKRQGGADGGGAGVVAVEAAVR